MAYNPNKVVYTDTIKTLTDKTNAAMDDLAIIEGADPASLRLTTLSGVVNYSPTVLSTWDGTRTTVDGALSVPASTQYSTFLNQIGINAFNSLLNGYKVFVTKAANTASGNNSIIVLPAPPTAGIREDLVFLEAWFPSTGDGTQLSWRIRMVAGVDFTANVMDGMAISSGWWPADETKAVYAQGTNASTIDSTSTTPVSKDYYKFHSATLNNSGWASPNLTDVGLYIAGRGDASSKTALGTLDGYVYAVPLLRVKRRNSAVYSATNTNGARDYYNLSGKMTYASGVTTITVTAVASTAGVKVGDRVIAEFVQNAGWRNATVTAFDSSTVTLQLDQSTSDTTGNANFYLRLISDRPDSLYSNIIDSRDITDLRHRVSLTGYNYDLEMRKGFDQYMRGELSLKTMNKEAFGLLQAPFGVPQVFQTTNLLCGDGVTRSLVNLVGLIGNCSKLSDFAATLSATLDTTVSLYNTTSLRFVANVANNYASIDVPAAVSGKYFVAVADVRLSRYTTGALKMHAFDIGAFTTQESGVVSATGTILNMWQPIYIKFAGRSGGVRLSVGTHSSLSNLDYNLDGIRFYEIDQTTYNNLDTQTNLTGATNIAGAFPFVDSMPNLVENLIPPFTDPGWTLDATTTITNPYTIAQTNSSTSTFRDNKVSIPVVAGQTYMLSANTNSAVAASWYDSTNTFISSLVNGSPFTSVSGVAPANATILRINFFNPNGNTGSWTTSNPMLERNYANGVTYPNAFVPYGRWFMPGDYLNGVTKYRNQPTGFDGIRTNFSDAQVSQTVTDVVKATRTPQRHMKITQATEGTWAASTSTIAVTSYYGIINGVIDADTAVATLTKASDATGLLYVDDTSKLAVNDTLRAYQPSTGVLASSIMSVTAVDTANKSVTVSPTLDMSWLPGTLLVETTSSSSVPVVKDSGGATVAGTWAGLGTKTATFTVTTAPATATTDLSIQYSVVYPAGQGLQYLPISGADVLQATINGDVLKSSNTVAVSANFKGKVVGNTDAVPHISRYYAGSALTTPPSFTSSSEFTATAYGNIAANDGTVYSTPNSTNGYQTQHVFKFDVIRAIEDKYGELSGCVTLADKVAWVKANVSKFLLTWAGYGSKPGGNSATIAPWNSTTLAWGIGSSHSSNSVTTVTVDNTYVSVTNLVDANGYIYYNASAPASDGVTASTIYTDYVQLDITLVTAETGYTVLQPMNPYAVMSQNWLSRNQAFPVDFGSDIVGYGNGTVTQSITGTGVLQIVADGTSGNQGIRIPLSSAPPQGSYTFYALVKVPAGITVGVNAYYSDTTYDTVKTSVGTGNWQWLPITTVGTKTLVNLYVYLTTTNASSVTYQYGGGMLVAGTTSTVPAWTPGRNKSIVLNYLGKTAGDTMGNPHKFGGRTSASFATPPAVDGTITIERVQASYDAIMTPDGTLSNLSTSVVGAYAEHLFEFDLSHLGMSLSELKASVRNIAVSWTGYGSGDNAGVLTSSASMKVWAASASSWIGWGTNTTSAPSTITNGFATSNYVTNDQKVYVLVNPTYTASATNPCTIYTDYVSVTVTLSDNVDYVKSNIVKVNPVSKEIKTMFPCKSWRYTGNGGAEDQVTVWYNHLPVHGYGNAGSGDLVTILAEIPEFFVSDLGTSVASAKQGTHPYQNPLYRLGIDHTDVFGTLGFGAIPFASDSKGVNIGAMVTASPTGFSSNVTKQYGVKSILKYPMVGTARYLVNHGGEIKLYLASFYTNTGLLDVWSNGVGKLVPLPGRPLTKEPQGAVRSGSIIPTAWRTSEGMVEGFVKSDGTI